MKQKIKYIIGISVIAIFYIATVTYALIPSDIEYLKSELEQNRDKRIANTKILDSLKAENEYLETRADQIKIEMFGEEAK